MRWDQWWRGAIASGFVTAVAIAPALVLEGITAREGWMLLSSFLGGIVLWCKDHKIVWDGIERRRDCQ